MVKAVGSRGAGEGRKPHPPAPSPSSAAKHGYAGRFFFVLIKICGKRTKERGSSFFCLESDVIYGVVVVTAQASPPFSFREKGVRGMR
jgi:hypothetical protein